ncbi:MAG: hypothetical protein JEZ03_08320 [Bacteroidales bacterium]|nr:hypothetical protein [Bacteroidales bacterium]
MKLEKSINNILNYFDDKLSRFGSTPQGADWNSIDAQQIRFEQLLKIVKPDDQFSLMDYGSGFGALIEYMKLKNFNFREYFGYDILDSMVQKGESLFEADKNIHFTTSVENIPAVDYAVASGVFNIRLNISTEEFTIYMLNCLEIMHEKSIKGFSANFLTKYSDENRMRPDLFYADPGFVFDYCKKHFSRNVALLHDYDLYDFTILVRKSL